MRIRKFRFCLTYPIFFRFFIFIKFTKFSEFFFIFPGCFCQNPSNIWKFKALFFRIRKQIQNICSRSVVITILKKSWFLRFYVNLCWRLQKWWCHQNFGDVILFVLCQGLSLRSFIWFWFVVQKLWREALKALPPALRSPQKAQPE